MKPKLGALGTLLLVAALTAVASGTGALGCSSATASDAEATDSEIQEADGLFGDDRVADVLKGHLDKIPNSFAEAEKLFGVGRACARTDSKEVYVVGEAQTRLGGVPSTTAGVLPRALVTGCNTPEHAMPETTDPLSGSFSLFVALFGDEHKPDAKSGDTMVVDSVEVMALDRKTGLYNFYAFESSAEPGAKPTGPGSMRRIRLMPNNDVMVWEKAAGKGSSVTTSKSEDRACNGCHVNMGPLMNELHEPWTNWVSAHGGLPTSTKLSGETLSIVSEAKSVDNSHQRLSFADALMRTMESGMTVWNEGLTNVPGSGFAQANFDGDQPKGAAGLLKSVFCETELQYDSVGDIVPLSLFIDPGAVNGAQIAAPNANKDDLFPILMPVRSEMDKRIEMSLFKKGTLSRNTIRAVRLADEENDVFSARRCNLYPKVLEGLPKDPMKIDAHVRSVLKREIAVYRAGVVRDFVTALLADAADVDAAKAKYFEDVRARVADDVKKLDSPEGRKELKKRSQARKTAAEKMFEEGAPRPILPAEQL